MPIRRNVSLRRGIPKRMADKEIRIFRPAGRLRPLFVLLCLFVVLSTATRVILLLQAWGELDAGPRLLAMIFATGFFFHCVTFSYFAVPFALILLLLPDVTRRSRYMRPFTYAVF